MTELSIYFSAIDFETVEFTRNYEMLSSYERCYFFLFVLMIMNHFYLKRIFF